MVVERVSMNAKAKALREKLEGALIPAVPVPFNLDGEHCEQAEKQLVRYLADSPAAGVAVWAHTGRGLKLTHGERHRVFKRWRIGLRPDQFVIAGVGCSEAELERGVESLSDAEYIARASQMAEEARVYGADGILVYAPTKFRGRPDQDEMIVDYMESIAAVGLPMIMFYLYESAGGISYGTELLENLISMDEVAGIKVATLDSVMTFQQIAELVRLKAPEIALLTGEDRFLGYSIMRGAVGALIGLGVIQPATQVKLISCWQKQRLNRFAELLLALDHLAETIFIQPMEGYIRRLMIALSAEGILPQEETYDPWGPPIPHPERAAIAAAVAKLKTVKAD